MAIDRRIGTKVDKTLRKEEAPAIRITPYPYIGIVKNNLDPTRCGRVQVWIPDMGGDEENSKNWRTVSYASPFMGTTNPTSGSDQNSYTHAPQTYGMWMVPPDIGVEVIVIFIAGDALRGYWIACVNSSVSRYMLPGLASSTKLDTTYTAADVKKSITPDYQYPVTEPNSGPIGPDGQPTRISNDPNFRNAPKPIHEFQFNVLRTQGLDRDITRGTITSSSQRETPSNVFGISTPGRPVNDPADEPEVYAKKLKDGTLTKDDYPITARKGGHTFIMDDGGAGSGIDQLIRLRTAQGHQIMMHDTDNTLYIANADGTVWLEMDGSGRLDIFSTAGFNLRTQGSINMHADKNININAGGKLNMRAEKTVQIDTPQKVNVVTGAGINLQTKSKFEIKSGAGVNIDTAGSISLKAGPNIILDASALSLKTNTGTAVDELTMAPLNSLSDTLLDPTSNLYKVNAAKINSIVTVAPGHEPYYIRKNGPPPPELDMPKIIPQQTYTAAAAGDNTKIVGTGVEQPVDDFDVRNQPIASGTIGTLTIAETTALMAQLAKNESGGESDPYAAKNPIGYIGKYQFGAAALKDLGYIKKSVSTANNSKLFISASWTGKDGLTSVDDYYAAHATQEKIALAYQQINYNTLIRIGALAKDDTPGRVGGMLQVAWFGPGNAKKWRNKEIPDVYQGNPYRKYFDSGKYAVMQASTTVIPLSLG